MPMWLCDFTACSDPAVRVIGECILCQKHLCSTHLQSQFHDCPKWEDADRYDPIVYANEEAEVKLLLLKIKEARLAEFASSLRNGVGASIPATQYDATTRNSVMGGMNYHVDILFDDGVVWLARIRRRNATSPPLVVQDYIVKSEAATLKFFEQHITVPVPRVHGYALSTDVSNSIGAAYLLIDKMPGKSFDKSLASKEQMEKLITQLADMYIELSRHSFPQMASLNEPSTSNLNFIARETLMDLDLNASKVTGIGPCSAQKEYHTASIEMVLELILRGEMYAEKAIDGYLVHLFLLDVLDMLPFGSSSGETTPQFFLKHADDKGDHILVDEDFNITGIIDWEWAYTAPIEMAFNSPLLLLPVGDFYDGKQPICGNEEFLASCFDRKGERLLANAVRTGRVHHFFAFCCGCDLRDWKGFEGLFRGLRDAADLDAGIDWVEWKERALQRYGDDQGLKTLMLTHSRID